mmetsp:Transcript_15254/g.28717  ORF Transcript_15254/g.28717 Transcript_15254/m.28717 type:complete len:1362 (+) Transcript_15254:108-4193(+)
MRAHRNGHESYSSVFLLLFTMMRCTGIVLAHAWKSNTGTFIKTLWPRYRCKRPILHLHDDFIPGYKGPPIQMYLTHFTPTLMFRAGLTTLSAKNSAAYNEGDRVTFDVGGSRYEGSVQGKNGGWYKVMVQNEKEGGTMIVKKRASQMTFISNNASDLTQQSYDQSNDIAGFDDRYSIHEASSIPELIDQTLDSTTIMNIDLLLRCEGNNDDFIRNKKEQQYLEQCKYFSKTQRWVTFTDLHVAPNTLSTCLDVLSIVHQEAKRQDAGVLFLGDFWHHRGTVRVDCLNAVLSALSEWEVPMIMIPGNHDQVSLGGQEHALTPLQNAYRIPTNKGSIPGILIFSHPTKFLEALFVPHIREIGIMQSILQSNTSARSSAVFVHADVTGAYMNDLMVSTGGVAPAYFPPSVPIYSGHFHKPHVLTKPEAAPNVSIRYVGSPYETSLAEARQGKALLVLDTSQNWKCVQEIPMNVGKRHFRCRGIQELLDLKIYNDESIDGAVSGTSVSDGDRIVVSVDQEELEELRRNTQSSNVDDGLRPSVFDEKVKELRAVGASVEIRETKSTPNLSYVDSSTSSGSNSNDLEWLLVEDMSPLTTWSNYLEREVNREAIKNTTAEILLKYGNEVLNNEGAGIVDPDEEKSQSEPIFGKHLIFDEITLEGFGPFKDTVRYPLSDRGLVLLRGLNRDGGSDSNGSGKSTLAMSALWALTGSIDSRPASDGKVSDCVHDNSSTARVNIRGSVNGKDFVVARSKSATRGSLTFIVDGEDRTKQSVKETQEAIEETLGTHPQILSRTIFHGQHTINGLLEASDAKLKDELSIIVPLDIWQDGAARARKKGRDLLKTVSELDGMILIRQRDIETLRAKHDSVNRMVATKRQTFLDFEDQVKKRLDAEESNDDEEYISIDSFQSKVEECRETMQQIEEMIQTNSVNAQNDLTPLQELLECKLVYLNDEELPLQNIQRQCDRNELALNNAKENLQSLQSQYGLSDITDETSTFSISSPSVCPTCKQTMSDHITQQHFKDEVKRSLSEAMSTMDALNSSLTNDWNILRNKKELVDDLKGEIQSIRSDINSRQTQWNQIERDLQLKLQHAINEHTQRSKEISEAVRKIGAMNEWNRIKSNLQSELKSHQDSLNNAMDNLHSISKDYNEMIENVKNLESEREVARSEAEIISNVAEHFGPRGVQTFILQNAVHDLQLASQYYLDELSDGSIRLELILDSGDRILRSASVLKSDGSWISRPLSSLSGGQWRRCSLALSLGFSDLVARRGRFSSSLLVLDEPLTHLDSAGRDNVGKLLRKVIQRKVSDDDLDSRPKRFGGLSVSTILIILQDLVAEELSESFDCIDEVVKFKGHSKLVLDEERFST